MKRSVLLIVALSVFILGTGCRKPQEITDAQYKQVMAVAREEFASEGLVHGGLEPFIRIVFPKWLAKRNVFVLYTKKPIGSTIPRMAIKHSEIKKIVHRVIRKACRESRVSFDAFDKTHAKYGRFKLTYTEECSEFNQLLADFFQISQTTFDEKEEHDVIWDSDSAPQARLDPDKFERACWLAVDLGLPLGGEYRILIEINEDGETYINGELVSVEEYVSPIAVRDPYRLIYLMPDPQLPVGKLFEILYSVCTTGAQRVDCSDKLSKSLILKRTHYYPPSQEFVEQAVLIDLISDNQIRIREEEINPTEANLDSVIEKHFELAKHKHIVVVANDTVSCGISLKVGFAAKKVYSHVNFFPKGSIRPAAGMGLVR